MSGRAEPLRVQREAMPEDDVPLSGGDVAAPAAPIEEQEDGSWTLYRFQEAPAGGGATPSVAQAPAKGGSVRQRAAGTPFETDPPPAQDEPVEARPGIRHPTRVRAGGIDEVSVETAVTETRKPGPETDASESFERAPERISESRTLKGSTSASSMMPRLHSSSDEVPASVPNRMSRPISSFAAESVEGQRRPPGPGAPPEPLNGASGLSEAAHRPARGAGDQRGGTRTARGPFVAAGCGPAPLLEAVLNHGGGGVFPLGRVQGADGIPARRTQSGRDEGDRFPRNPCRCGARRAGGQSSAEPVLLPFRDLGLSAGQPAGRNLAAAGLLHDDPLCPARGCHQCRRERFASARRGFAHPPRASGLPARG